MSSRPVAIAALILLIGGPLALVAFMKPGSGPARGTTPSSAAAAKQEMIANAPVIDPITTGFTTSEFTRQRDFEDDVRKARGLLMSKPATGNQVADDLAVNTPYAAIQEKWSRAGGFQVAVLVKWIMSGGASKSLPDGWTVIFAESPNHPEILYCIYLHEPPISRDTLDARKAHQAAIQRISTMTVGTLAYIKIRHESAGGTNYIGLLSAERAIEVDVRVRLGQAQFYTPPGTQAFAINCWFDE